MELSLADLVPLWRTLREQEVTAMVTPALDYVGGLELGTTDMRFAGDDQIAHFGEAMRNLVSSLEDDCSLLFLYRVSEDTEDDVRAYEAAVQNASPQALRAYVASRAQWLRAQPLRVVRLLMFFAAGAKEAAAPGAFALRLAFADADKLSHDQHSAKLQELAQLRDRLQSRFAAQGVGSRELTIQDFWRLHYQLLNPTRSRARHAPPAIRVRDDLWADCTVRAQGEHLREYTEAEQLVFENLEEHRGYFRQGDVLRRALTLKVLPEQGTSYFGAERLFTLAARGAGGEERPFGYTLAVAVRVERQRGVSSPRWKLKSQHALVSALAKVVPFLQSQDIDKEAADQSKQDDLRKLFVELNNMSSKLASLSVTVLLEATNLFDLEAQTEAARTAFGEMGNSELLAEEVSQLPAFLSLFPGSINRQLRRKGCTTRNAADFVPVFAPWRGCSRPSSLLFSPSGDSFRFDLFDKSLAEAHHGFVAADTGSGKSVTIGMMVLDALASGTDAILLDNGESWRPLTELMGGTHIAVNLKESISPFGEYERMLNDDGSNELSPSSLQEIVNFIEVCVTDVGEKGFGNLDTDLVSRVVRLVYETLFREKPTQRPLISHFRDALLSYGATVDEKRRSGSIAERLNIYCDGLFAGFLNQESKLRFDGRLLTFEMREVSSIPAAKKLAMAAIMQAIGSRAIGGRGARRNRTIVAVDEGHEYLGSDAVAERFLAACYRKMRKYDVAMWMISQQLADFANSPVGDAIIGNSHLKIFLKHGEGAAQRSVIEYFRLSPRAAQAFATLDRRRGHYSDFFLMYGAHSTTVRMALHPLAYWILTTDKADKDLIERAVAKNPRLDRLTVLEELAVRHPHGAPRADGRTAA